MYKFSLRWYLKEVLSILLISSLFQAPCDGIRLGTDGGYEIVIGVEDNVIETNSKSLLEEIRVGIDSFSTELWKATNQRFYIKSVDVLVPVNWWTINDHETATWQTLLDSEIRLTSQVAAPTSVNPNPCGSSGLYIDLPDDFFKVPRGGPYGSVGKALVNLWARYRFGVWEEHGIPGDTQFPYFYTKPSLAPRWEATGCSNEEITGKFQTLDGDESDRCDPYRAEISDDCRFHPSPLNTANSSLLHFHWLDSITHFCDRKTHNHVASNRQNLLCGHRSIWEVIRESDDYKTTKSITDSVPRPKFRVIKESKSPELYILLDRGRTVTPVKVLQEVMTALNGLVNTPTIERINIAVGTYPHANVGKDHYYVKEEVGWAPINEVINDLQSVFEKSSEPDGPVIRDFGLAIQEAAERIKQRNHLAGTVMLVVKRGAGPNVFDKITHEQEVIASLKEDNRIKVFAIEAQQGEQMPYTNLQNLVESTSGQYHLINDTMNTGRKLGGILETILEILEQPSIMSHVSSWVTQKQYTKPNEEIQIPIYDSVNLVKIQLTTNKHMVAAGIELTSSSNEHGSLEQLQKFEWNENSDLSRRLVFTYLIGNPKQGSTWTLKHGCNTEELSECRFFLVVTAEGPRQSFSSKSIQIDVSTSAEHNYLDMSHHGMKIVPFAIFAKIEMNRQRILGLENVTALVRLGGDHDSHIGTWTIDLKDDGLGLPDVSAHDGIYSGVFTPPEDGLYQVSVHALGVSNEGGSSFQDVRIVNQAGSLISKDQYNFGCRNSSKPRCQSGVPLDSFSRVMDMESTVAVENAATFKPGKPMKILDFSVTTLPNFNIEFGFTSPRLLGSDADPEEYRIYMAPHVDNFLGSTDMTQLLVQQIGAPPGEYVTIHFNALKQAIPYYAVEAIYKGQKGGPSNVIGVVPFETDPIVPSPTTTTQRPSTTPVSPTNPSTTDYPDTTTTDEPDETTDVSSSTSTTPSPSDDTDGPSSSSTSTTTEVPPSSTTEIPGISSSLAPSTSTTTETPIISTSEEPGASTTTEVPTTPIPTTGSTSVPPEITSSSESPSSISTTSSPPVSTDITDPVGSSSTTQSPSSTPDEDVGSSSPSTTENPPSSESTTENLVTSTAPPSSTAETVPSSPSSSSDSPTTHSTSAEVTISTEPSVGDDDSSSIQVVVSPILLAILAVSTLFTQTALT